mmetsp:Transcript_70848/g.230177  ORF Transcript_70848/g.230177 Transcript_70848/m.230177 type:complete len:213 (+) Transcript_70848:957-1595(+)
MGGGVAGFEPDFGIQWCRLHHGDDLILHLPHLHVWIGHLRAQGHDGLRVLDVGPRGAGPEPRARGPAGEPLPTIPRALHHPLVVVLGEVAISRPRHSSALPDVRGHLVNGPRRENYDVAITWVELQCAVKWRIPVHAQVAQLLKPLEILDGRRPSWIRDGQRGGGLRHGHVHHEAHDGLLVGMVEVGDGIGLAGRIHGSPQDRLHIRFLLFR